MFATAATATASASVDATLSVAGLVTGSVLYPLAAKVSDDARIAAAQADAVEQALPMAASANYVPDCAAHAASFLAASGASAVASAATPSDLKWVHTSVAKQPETAQL